MSGWFSVPEWDGPPGSAKTAGTKKSHVNKKPRTDATTPNKSTVAAKPTAQLVKPAPATSAGQFVRPPKPATEPVNKKRKLDKLPAKPNTQSPAKKQKLSDKPTPAISGKNTAKTAHKKPAAKIAGKPSKNDKPAPSKAIQANGKSSKKPSPSQQNGKATSTKTGNKTTKAIQPNGKSAQKPELQKNGKNSKPSTKNAIDSNPFDAKNAGKNAPKKKKKVAVKPAKPLQLADEESDTELAAEVNSFRKKLLKGFTGAREVGGKPDPNAKFSDDDDDDENLGLSDSDSDNNVPRQKKVKKAAADAKSPAIVKADAAKKPAAKKVVAAQSDDEDDEEAPPLVPISGGGNNSFRDKLIGNLKGSRFRYLNEQLYSSEGSSAVKLFREDRAAFTAYHEGYRQQVQQWPLNPLDRIIKSIKKLPKTHVIADFGCGEGRLAKAVPNKTYSLDLVAQRHEIIACDMAKTPLETGSIDVAVYCLSLMGTNLRDFVLEANRVLKMNGTLKIAEVESRFDDVRTFVENIKACGFQHVNTDKSSKFFVFLNFLKVRSVDKSNRQVPAFSLKPCLYKKR